MSDHQPAGFRFDGRAAVADLNKFPQISRPEQDLTGVPEMELVGKHQVHVFVVLPGQHRITAVDFAREQRHPLVLHLRPVQRADLEVHKVPCLQHLRQDHLAIIGRVGRVIGRAAVLFAEGDESRVLNASDLGGTGGKDDPLGQSLGRVKVNLVIGLGHR